jgi:TldD protein
VSQAFRSADRLGPNPLAGIDAVVAEQLLGEALAAGGDYADLYFEFRCGADFVLEETQVRSVGRVLVVGLGVRVLRGDATGYAYTEELSAARMSEAARTAGQIAAAGGQVTPMALTLIQGSDTYPVPE